MCPFEGYDARLIVTRSIVGVPSPLRRKTMSALTVRPFWIARRALR